MKNRKKKIFFLLLMSIGFGIGGFWIIFGQGADQRALSTLIIGGYGCIILFGFGIYAFIKQLLL